MGRIINGGGQDNYPPRQCNGYFPILSSVHINGADAFKLPLYLISRGLEGIDARIVHTLLHHEIVVKARDAIADPVEAIVKERMEETFRQIIPEVPFVAEIRVAEAWG